MLQAQGLGNQISRGQFGDLYVRVTVKPHPRYSRRGLNLIVTEPITISQAVIGAKIKVETPDGMKQINIPAGTQFGDFVTLKNQGIQKSFYKRGDMIIALGIVIPNKLSPEEREAYDNLAKV